MRKALAGIAAAAAGDGPPEQDAKQPTITGGPLTFTNGLRPYRSPR